MLVRKLQQSSGRQPGAKKWWGEETAAAVMKKHHHCPPIMYVNVSVVDCIYIDKLFNVKLHLNF